MSLDKAIRRGKERRKPYRRGAAASQSCRHGGSCPWCRGNRTIKARKLKILAREAMKPESEGRDGIS